MATTKSKPSTTVDSSALIELAAFEFALKIVESACGPLPAFVLSTVDGKKGSVLQLSGSLNGNEAVYRVPGTVANLSTAIEVPRDVFAQAVKGRKDATLTVKANTLVIKSGKYEAVVNVSDSSHVPDVTVPESTDDHRVTSFTLTSELHAYLSQNLPKIKVERAHVALPEAMLNVRVTPKLAYLAAYEHQNSCFLFDTKAKFDLASPISLVIPYERFASFIKALPVANCALHVTPDALITISNQFRLKIALPAADSESGLDPDVVFEKAKEIRKSSGNVLTIQQADLVKFLDNARALVAVGTEVQFKSSKTGTLLLVESSRGSVKTQVKSTGSVKDFGLIYAFVQTLLTKMDKKPSKQDDGADTSSEVSFEVVDNLFCVCRASVIYAALLSANGSGSGDSDGEAA